MSVALSEDQLLGVIADMNQRVADVANAQGSGLLDEPFPFGLLLPAWIWVRLA